MFFLINVLFFETQFSLLSAFANIFEPLIMAMFMWNLITICSALLIIQIEIVQFCLYLIFYVSVVINCIELSNNFLDKSCWKYIVVGRNNTWGRLFFWYFVHCLWTWTAIQFSICWILWHVRAVRFLFIPGSSSTNATYDYELCPATS